MKVLLRFLSWDREDGSAKGDVEQVRNEHIHHLGIRPGMPLRALHLSPYNILLDVVPL